MWISLALIIALSVQYVLSMRERKNLVSEIHRLTELVAAKDLTEFRAGTGTPPMRWGKPGMVEIQREAQKRGSDV
jgi:hypothetical protein